MKENMLEYKGYHTIVRYNAETGILRGIIEGINDFVDFQTDNLSEVKNEFHRAVDDYLEFCAEVGKEPEKEYRGTFNVRIKPELHKKLALRALENGESLNSVVERAISLYLSDHIVKKLVNNMNGIAKDLCENAIRESGINDTKKYTNNIRVFRSSKNVKEG